MNKFIALFLCLALFGCEKEPPPPAPIPPGKISQADKEWIKTQTIRVGGDANYPPFVFADADGKMTGLAIEYFDEVARKLDLKYEVTFIGQRAEMLKKLEAKEIDVTLASRTSASRPYLIVTQPYEYTKGAIVVRKGHTTNVKQVGAGRGYASVTWLKLNKPEIQVVEFDDDAKCLQALKAKTVESCIMGREIAFFLLDKLKYPQKDFDLTPVAYDYFLSFGVHIDNPGLVSLLSKGMDLIPSSRRREILQKWLKEPDA